MLNQLLGKVFGTKHERDLKRMQPLVAAVNEERRLPVPSEADALWGIETLNVPRSTSSSRAHRRGSTLWR